MVIVVEGLYSRREFELAKSFQCPIINRSHFPALCNMMLSKLPNLCEALIQLSELSVPPAKVPEPPCGHLLFIPDSVR
jgi:hypothetical protein